MMVRQLKEDQAGKSEEELAECFRVLDKYVSLGLATFIYPTYTLVMVSCTYITLKLTMKLTTAKYHHMSAPADSPCECAPMRFVVGTETDTSTGKSLLWSSAAAVRALRKTRSMTCWRKETRTLMACWISTVRPPCQERFLTLWTDFIYSAEVFNQGGIWFLIFIIK